MFGLVMGRRLDLRCAAVDVQLDAGNEAGIIGCQKESSGRNLAWFAHSTHWDYVNEAVLYFLKNAVEYRRIYRAGADDIYLDPSFELGSPSSSERTYGRFAGAVHDSIRKSLHSGNKTIQND